MLLGLIFANYYKIQNDKIKAIENEIAEEKRIEELNPSEEIFLCIDEEIELDSIERYDDSILKVTNKQDKCIIKGIEVGYTICYVYI